jgi:hypothetical protein
MNSPKASRIGPEIAKAMNCREAEINGWSKAKAVCWPDQIEIVMVYATCVTRLFFEKK